MSFIRTDGYGRFACLRIGRTGRRHAAGGGSLGARETGASDGWGKPCAGFNDGVGLTLLTRSYQLAQTREISVWRFELVGPSSSTSRGLAGGFALPIKSNKRKCPGLDSSVEKTTGDPRIGSPVRLKALAAEAQLLQQLVILWQIVPLQIIEELATARSHLEKPAARVEILAVRAQVLGQVIDASGQERDLDLGRAGILFVSLIFGDDFGFNYCGGHGFVV